MAEFDIVRYFLVTEHNLVEPNFLLIEIRLAIQKNKSKNKFDLRFNDCGITIVNNKILIKSYYMGGEKLVGYFEFAERLFAHYKEHQYYNGKK